MLQNSRKAPKEAGYDGPGFGGLYGSLERTLQGSTLNMEDSHTIKIENIPKLDGISAIIAMYENRVKKLGLGILVDMGSDDIDSARAKQIVCEVYKKLTELPGMTDCSTEYTPGRTNKEAVDENRADPSLWVRKCQRKLTLSYMTPDPHKDGHHVILVKMPYKKRRAFRQAKYSLKHLGAEFSNHQTHHS